MNVVVESKIKVLIPLSFLVAFILMFLRLPGRLDLLYPQWLVLAVLYWALLAPCYVNVGVAWIVGFILDFLYNVPIGENAFALVLAAYCATRFRERILSLNFWGRGVALFSLIVLNQSILVLFQSYFGVVNSFFFVLIKSLVGAIILLVFSIRTNYQGKTHFECYH